MDRGFDQDCEPDFGHHGVCSRYCRGIDLGGSIVEIAAGTRGFIAAFNIHTPVLSTLQERFGRRKRLRSRLVQARLKAAAPVGGSRRTTWPYRTPLGRPAWCAWSA